MVTIKVKDIGVKVKDCFKKCVGYRKTLEDCNEEYIKNNLGVID